MYDTRAHFLPLPTSLFSCVGDTRLALSERVGQHVYIYIAIYLYVYI